MKILHIVGNRPQFVKLAILTRSLSQQKAKSLILHTGQHFDDNMSAVFFRDLEIPEPDFNLNVSDLPHNLLIGRMLERIDPVLVRERPDWVITYGDTDSTLAGSLAAAKRHLPLAHVEAGVRTGDPLMPEESNRFLSDRLADLNFCCTEQNLANLALEGIGSPAIPSRNRWVGDLMLDASQHYASVAREKYPLPPAFRDKPFVLATIHRAENRLRKTALAAFVDALNIIHQSTPVLCPLHPATRQQIQADGLHPGFSILEPQGYLEMLSLTQACSAVITDSGGLSREAFFFQKPVLVVMEHPFWPEILRHGNCITAASVSAEIVANFGRLVQTSRVSETGLFGDGHAAEKMVHELYQR